jgi:hypothetical protein
MGQHQRHLIKIIFKNDHAKIKGTKLTHSLDLIGSRQCVKSSLSYADVIAQNIQKFPPLYKKYL